MESNWIQTVPGMGWHMLFRLYGPEKAWFDKTWRPSEIELVKKVNIVFVRCDDNTSLLTSNIKVWRDYNESWARNPALSGVHSLSPEPHYTLSLTGVK